MSADVSDAESCTSDGSDYQSDYQSDYVKKRPPSRKKQLRRLMRDIQSAPSLTDQERLDLAMERMRREIAVDAQRWSLETIPSNDNLRSMYASSSLRRWRNRLEGEGWSAVWHFLRRLHRKANPNEKPGSYWPMARFDRRRRLGVLTSFQDVNLLAIGDRLDRNGWPLAFGLLRYYDITMCNLLRNATQKASRGKGVLLQPAKGTEWCFNYDRAYECEYPTIGKLTLADESSCSCVKFRGTGLMTGRLCREGECPCSMANRLAGRVMQHDAKCRHRCNVGKCGEVCFDPAHWCGHPDCHKPTTVPPKKIMKGIHIDTERCYDHARYHYRKSYKGRRVDQPHKCIRCQPTSRCMRCGLPCYGAVCDYYYLDSCRDDMSRQRGITNRAYRAWLVSFYRQYSDSCIARRYRALLARGDVTLGPMSEDSYRICGNVVRMGPMDAARPPYEMVFRRHYGRDLEERDLEDRAITVAATDHHTPHWWKFMRFEAEELESTEEWDGPHNHRVASDTQQRAWAVIVYRTLYGSMGMRGCRLLVLLRC
jgi:hypothetical protein